MRIWIQVAKPMWIRILIRLLCPKNMNFNMKNILKVGTWLKTIPYLRRYIKPFWNAENQVNFLCYIHALGCGTAFPTRIRIRIQDSQMNMDPGVSRFRSTTLVWTNLFVFVEWQKNVEFYFWMLLLKFDVVLVAVLKWVLWIPWLAKI
jgi:hypothetical protein